MARLGNQRQSVREKTCFIPASFTSTLQEKIGMVICKPPGHHIYREVKNMDTKNRMPQASRTNAQEIRQQNAQSQQNAGAGYGTEFASETNAQQVRQQNQQSVNRAKQNPQ
jgi:small acid-soluble spore protein E (minor gamma-type SASP)